MSNVDYLQSLPKDYLIRAECSYEIRVNSGLLKYKVPSAYNRAVKGVIDYPLLSRDAAHYFVRYLYEERLAPLHESGLMFEIAWLARDLGLEGCVDAARAQINGYSNSARKCLQVLELNDIYLIYRDEQELLAYNYMRDFLRDRCVGGPGRGPFWRDVDFGASDRARLDKLRPELVIRLYQDAIWAPAP